MKDDLMLSICLPAYNGEKVITQTLKSILSQSYRRFELIIIDDCSSDRTEKVIKAIKDKRIKYFKNTKNLGYSRNLEKCRQKAKGEILFLMGQDDILADNTLEKYKNIFSKNKNIGAITRPYFWFDKNLYQPVRAKKPLNLAKDETITIDDSLSRIITMFSTLDQLSGLALRSSFVDRPFHKDIFPCHVYPFAGIFKNHPVVMVKEYNIAVRMISSQTRTVSWIYDKSPVQSWVDMFNDVFPELRCKSFRQKMIKNFVATNLVGLVQIRNYARYSYLWREIWLLIKYRWQNVINPFFWFFSLGCALTPTAILIPVVNWYKNQIYSQKLKNIKFNCSLFENEN